MSYLPPTCYILRVPGELVFKCLEYLLPLIRDTENPRYALTLGNLSDLLQCRLVCHAFYMISSSLVWRRVKLILPGYRSPIPSALSTSRRNASKVTEIMVFLLNHTHFIKDIKLLTILANGPSYEQATRQVTVPTLSSLVPFFTNVRVLNLANISILGVEVMLQLFLCPSLHTVRLCNIDFSSLSSIGRTVNTSIKRLAIHRCQRPVELFSLMPSVRAFDGDIDEAFVRTTIWPSLNEVSFRNEAPKWNDSARMFLSWQQSRRNISPCFTELMISQWNFNPKIQNLYSIMHSFAGHPLIKLILYYVDKPSVENLEYINRFFPSLQQLSLLSDKELTQWPNSIESYADCLSGFNQLQLLEWNFYDDGVGDNNTIRDWDMISEDRLSEMVLCLANCCPHLEEVKFSLVIDGYMSVRLSRDRFGQPGIESIIYSDSSTFCTSSWTPFNFGDV